MGYEEQRTGLSRGRVGITLGVVAAYIGVALGMGKAMGAGVAALSVVPAAAAGLLCGLWAGVLTGALMWPLNTLLLNLTGLHGMWVVFEGGGGPGSLAVILIGGVMGRLRDLGVRLGAPLQARHRDALALAVAKEDVEASEERWRRLVDEAPAIVMNLTPEGTVTYINHGLRQVRPERLRGKNLVDYVAEHQREELRTRIASTLRTGVYQEFDLEAMDTDKRPAWYCVRMGPVREGGRVSGISLFAVDATARRQAVLEMEERAQQEQRRAESMDAVVRLAGVLVSTGDFAQKAHLMMEEITRAAEAAAAMLLTFDTATGQLRREAVSGPAAPVLLRLLSRGAALSAMRGRGPLVLDGRERVSAVEPALAAAGIGALVSVPVAAGKSGAVVCVCWRDDGSFTPELAARPVAMAQADGAGLSLDRTLVAG